MSATRTETGGSAIRWGWLLALPLLVSAGLLVGSQAVFLEASLYVDLGFGKSSPNAGFANYARILSDRYYLDTLWLTTYVSLSVAACSILAGFPIAAILARMRSRWASMLFGAIVLTSFITMVIQVFGLIIIFRGDGPVNRLLIGLGLLERPLLLIGTVGGVIIGLVYSTFGFAVMLLYSVVRTIPQSLEEAAAVHGASRARVFLRVILPLCVPGLAVGFLTVFNLCMGAFTSAALLGGGRVITLPVLIQRTMLLDVKYGMAGALAALLILSVLVLNGLSILTLRRFRAARLVV